MHKCKANIMTCNDSKFPFWYFSTTKPPYPYFPIWMLPMMWLRYFTEGFSLSRDTTKRNSRRQFNTTTMHPTDHDGFNNTATEIDIPLLAQSHYYFKAGLAVNNYYGLSLVGIGFIGNTLSLLVMLQVSDLFRIFNVIKNMVKLLWLLGVIFYCSHRTGSCPAVFTWLHWRLRIIYFS